MNAAVPYIEDMTEQEASLYEQGKTARRGEGPIEARPYSGLEWRSFWLAGFHDEDMAQGNRIYNGPERPRRGQ